MLVERKRLVNGIRFINFIDVCHGIDSRSFSYEHCRHASLYLAQGNDLDGRYEKSSFCVDSTCDSSVCVHCCL